MRSAAQCASKSFGSGHAWSFSISTPAPPWKNTRFSHWCFFGTRFPVLSTRFASIFTKPGRSSDVRITSGFASDASARPFSVLPSFAVRTQSRKYSPGGISPFTPFSSSVKTISSPAA